ncbi:universal stress protein [Ferruginivarius sediminum]|uniref:Universal stress protein n=1 Tax=Ferruginivarius sediminum TaxID=2661937 RepID=A0A369TBN4_9PROT|nr:universal stress protein [Ferruginivarius sediminum]RDD61805.1 universal stress protein [Ferruginivarius sediminum]
MFKKILVAVDGSQHALRAVEIASDLAEKYGAELTLLAVYKSIRMQESTHSLVRTRKSVEPQITDGELKQAAQEVADEAAAIARDHDIPKVDVVVKHGQPARTIAKVAEDQGADAIVLGSRGLGDVSGLLLGSVSHKVASLAKCSVITVK